MASLGVYLLDGGKTERMPTIFSTQSALRFIFFLIKEGRRKTGKQKKNEESKKPRRKKYLFKISTTLFSTNRSGRVFIRSRITRKDFHYIVHSLSLSLSLSLSVASLGKTSRIFCCLAPLAFLNGSIKRSSLGSSFFSVRNSLNGENKDKSE
jgi:uncharacterized protein YpmS